MEEKNNNIEKCPLCKNRDKEVLRINCTYISHMDFQPMHNQSDGLRRCLTCGTVFMVDALTINEIKNIYTGKKYVRVKKTEHRVYGDRADKELNTTYHKIFNFLKGSIINKSPRILDVACLDGKLLLEFEKAFPNSELHGFDVSESIKDVFPKKHNFYY